MTCEQTKNQLPDYLIGSLDERTNTELQRHLTDCASCRTEVESLRSIWADLQLLPAEQPSEALRARFYAMLHAYQQGLAHKQPGISWATRLNHWLERWWPKQPAFQFAFAVVFLILGVVVGQRLSSTEQEQQQKQQNASEIAQLRQEVHTMREMVTLSLLQQQSASERLKGVSWFHRVEQPAREVLSALLNTLSYDPNVNVRLAAVDALNQFADRSLVREGLVQALARQSSPLVQIELIDLLVQKREKQATATLTQLIQDEQINQVVKQRAEWGIEQLR